MALRISATMLLIYQRARAITVYCAKHRIDLADYLRDYPEVRLY